jgi:ethanolamine-phosphate cytidylyltransferase
MSVDFLKTIKEPVADYLMVGIHNDKEVNQYRGANYPVMNLLERVLCALSCKYVEDAVFGASFHVTSGHLLDKHRVYLVCHDHRKEIVSGPDGSDPYIVSIDVYSALNN